MRQSTVLFSAGSVFNLGGWDESFDRARGIVTVGLPDLLEAGIVETEPMIEAQILESYACVPGPARCVVVEPSTSPVSTVAMLSSMLRSVNSVSS